MRSGWIIFTKEILDNLRDRRAMVSALIYPLIGPVLVVLLLTVAGRTLTSRAETALLLPTIGAQRAPNLVSFLQQRNIQVVPGPADPEAEVREGSLDVVAVIPEGYGEDFVAGRPATVRLIVDASRQSASASVQRVRGALAAYSGQIGTLRLIARGINPSITDALAVELVDLSTPQSQAAQLLNIAPYFIIFSIFIGGMYLAIDSTAGEKERGSLEPLLINPVPRSVLVLGKMGAVLVFTFMAVVETLIGFALVLNLVPLENYLGIRIHLEPLSLLTIFLLTLPMMVLAASLQIVIATFTKGFKEAQNYLSFLPLIPALPGMFLAFLPVRPQFWNMLIPTFGQQLLINQVMRGESMDPVNVAISALATLLVGGLMTWVAVRLYDREAVLFGR